MYDGKRFAVFFDFGGRLRAVMGWGVYETDDQLGPVLRVSLQDQGHRLGSAQTLLLEDRVLRGRVAPGDAYGCDFLVDLRTSRCERESLVAAGA